MKKDEQVKLTIQDALEKDKSQYPHALLRSIPPSYAFSSSSDRCLPGFLFCALGVRLNICHCLQAKRSKSLLLNFTKYLLPTFFSLHCFSFWAVFFSLRSDHKCASVIVLGRAVLRLSSSAPRLAASPCYSKGCWRGEAQVCVMLSQSRSHSESWNQKKLQKKIPLKLAKLNLFKKINHWLTDHHKVKIFF